MGRTKGFLTICEFLRRVEGVSMRELANVAHCSETVISIIENARSYGVSDEMMRDVAIALGWEGAPADICRKIERGENGLTIV